MTYAILQQTVAKLRWTLFLLGGGGGAALHGWYTIKFVAFKHAWDCTCWVSRQGLASTELAVQARGRPRPEAQARLQAHA